MGIKRYDEFGRPNVRNCTCKDKSCREKWLIDFEEDDTWYCPSCEILHCPDCLRKLGKDGATQESSQGYLGYWMTLRCNFCGYYLFDVDY